MKHTAFGVDIAKNFFQVHYVHMETGEIVNKPIKRANFLEFFANRPLCQIGIEALGGAHHSSRQFRWIGHRVRLMQARFIKAFNIGNKNDAAVARAIWLAVLQPGKDVAVKTEAQQAVLALRRMRQQLIKLCTMQLIGLRGLLTEYGEVKAVAEIPGVGLLSTSVAVTTMGEARAFKSGREFADKRQTCITGLAKIYQLRR